MLPALLQPHARGTRGLNATLCVQVALGQCSSAEGCSSTSNTYSLVHKATLGLLAAMLLPKGQH